jgi:hypothetical protein
MRCSRRRVKSSRDRLPPWPRSRPVAAVYVATTSPDYLSTVVALTLCVGVVYVLLGVFRMGWVSNFLAKAVLEGFIFAPGLGLIVDQLPSILGIPKAKGSYWDVLVGVVKDLDLTNLTTLAVGAVARRREGHRLAPRQRFARRPRAVARSLVRDIARWGPALRLACWSKRNHPCEEPARLASARATVQSSKTWLTATIGASSKERLATA